MAIEWAMIEEFEGGLHTDGYVPKQRGRVIGESGVTVGAGVDLGSRTAAGLRSMGVSPEIVELLIPYLGIRGQSADSLLMWYPVRLTTRQARALTEAVKKSIVKEVAHAYEKRAERKWDDLPDRAQTVIASLAFNFGSRLWTDYHTTWELICKNDWAALSRFLRGFPSKQKELDERRKREGIHLMPLYIKDAK